MALSRTARILIAGVLLAAAAFFWLNFFNQSNTVETPPTAVPATTPSVATTPAGTTPANLAGTPAVAPPANASGAATTGTPVGTATGAATGNGIVTTPEEVSPATGVATPATATPVVVADPPAVVLRDLVVDQLPFLVTEPPSVEVAVEDEDDSEAARAVIAARANVNPFSPIVVQAPPAAAQQPIATTPMQTEPSEPDVVVVTGTPEPSGTGVTSTPVVSTPVAAPAPRTVAPASTRTAELPRPLPSGTLSSVPDILQTARTQPSAQPGPANLSTVAAVVVPEPEEAAELPSVTSEGDVAAATAPEPIGPGHVQQTAAVTPSLPLAVGADPLSRYLRDNNVRFTGQVLGPLSVGVFRSNMYQQPAVVLLGQTLPDSEILLSDLRGYEARFTLGNSSQVLSLDTRR